MVPPVPTPATKISTFPPVCSQISGPVVALCAAGFAGFTNWPKITAPGISFASSSAFAIAPFIPLAPSVKTSSAPYAFKRFLRSTLMVSGSVKIALYPLTAATAARPIPVLPLVGSIMVAPSFKIPFFSASSIIANAILSFTEPAGLNASSFTKMAASVTPAFAAYLLAFTIGVFPTNSNVLDLISLMFISSLFCEAKCDCSYRSRGFSLLVLRSKNPNSCEERI